jgi:tRNA-dependent cyclodipeptide synthase
MPDSPSEATGLPRISVVRTTPKVSDEQLFAKRRCYIGISLDNPVFYGKSLKAILTWGEENFDHCLIVLGDYLRRFNEYIFNSLNDEAAEKASFEAGNDYIAKTKDIFQQFNEDKLQLARWKDCLQADEFKKSRAILSKLYDTLPAFKASVQRDAFLFLKRQKRKNQKMSLPMEEAIELSSQYLLEEIAVFSSLSEQGWKVELYPGPELTVLVDIAKGQYSDIPQGLKERVNVELRISKSKTE